MVKLRKDEKTGQAIKTYERGYPVGFKATLQVRARRCSGRRGAALAACRSPVVRPRCAPRPHWPKARTLEASNSQRRAAALQGEPAAADSRSSSSMMS